MPALRLALVLASSLAVLSCNPASRSSKLGVSVRGAATPSVRSVEIAPGLSVDRVRVLVKKLELEGGMDATAPGMAMATSAADHGDDGGEGEIGPLVVDVSGTALTGSVTHVFDADVPEGVFDELRIVIAPVAGAMMGTPLGDMGTSSVIVDGTHTPQGATSGTPFTFASSLTAEQKLETQLVVDHAGNSANVTLVLEVRRWFTAADGSPLDPTVDANRAAIEANMLASLRFERDDDEDGVDDDSQSGH